MLSSRLRSGSWLRRVWQRATLPSLVGLFCALLLLTLPALATSPADIPGSPEPSVADMALLNGPTLAVGSGNVAPGNNIVVPLDTSLGGEMLGAVTVEIEYDPAVLTAAACTPDPGGLFDTALCNHELAPDKVGLTAISAGGVSGDAGLAEITFQAVGAAGESSALTLTVDPFSDPDGLAHSVTLQNGLINVVSATSLTVGSGDVTPGNTIVVPLDASLDGEALGETTIHIQYDDSVLRATACTADPGGLFDTAVCDVNPGYDDKVVFAAMSATGVSGDPRLAEITFLAEASVGDSSALTLTADPFFDPDGQAIDVTLHNGLIKIVSAANSPYTLNLSADPSWITADGTSTSTLTSEVEDEQGDPVDDGTVVVYSTDLGTFPGGLSFTPIPIGIETVEAESADVAKVGTWVEYDDTNASGGKGVISDTVGDKVSYTFVGTQVSVLFQKQFDAGLAEVFVDGVSYGKIDTYWDDGSGTGVMYQQEEEIATDLPYATHTIEVLVTGEQNPASDGSFVLVDALRVFGTDQNGAYLTSGGVSTIPLSSGTTAGTAQVTACAGEACDTEPVYFRHPQGYVYLPLICKEYVEPLPPECQELIRNGGFEDNTAWIRGVTPRPARYTTEKAHSGARSMLLGLKAGETDVRSYSSVRQTIAVPDDIESATLTFWFYPVSELDEGDRQDCLLLNEHDQLVAILMRDNVNGTAWTKMTYDLSAYAGETLQLYFNAYNDGDGSGVTAFYLDDVSVEVCEGEPTPPTPTPPPGPEDCYIQFLEDVDVGEAPHGVTVNSDGKRLYVANHDDDTLSVIDSETYALLSTEPVGDQPKQVAHNAANDRVYVTNGGADTVTVLEASDLGSSKTVDVGQHPNGVAANAATNKVYVANYDSGTVSVIDGVSDTVSETIPVGVGPSMVAVNPDTNKAYVSLYGEGKVAVIDGAGAVTKVDIFSSAPYGVTVDTLRNLVYVVTIDSYRIVAIDGNTDTFLGWAEIRRMPAAEPVPLRMVAVNPLIGTSGHIFVTTTGEDSGWNKILLLPKGWPEYFARAYALDLNEPREGIAFEPASLRVFVTSRADDLVAAYQDGEPACPTNFLAGALGRGLATEPGEGYAVEDYQIRVCVAGPDGTCARMLTR